MARGDRAIGADRHPGKIGVDDRAAVEFGESDRVEGVTGVGVIRNERVAELRDPAVAVVIDAIALQQVVGGQHERQGRVLGVHQRALREATREDSSKTIL